MRPNLATLALCASFAMACADAEDSASQTDGPATEAVYHYQTGEQVMYVSLRVHDPDAGVRIRTLELPLAQFRDEICTTPDRKRALWDLDRRTDLADTNRNLTPRLGSLADLDTPDAALHTNLRASLDRTVRQVCQEE